MEYTEQQILAIGGRPWTSRTGVTRIYLNDWEMFIGLDTTRYGTGRVSGATLDGQQISNNKANRILAETEVWWEDGKIRARGGIVAEDLMDELRAGVATAVATL